MAATAQEQKTIRPIFTIYTKCQLRVAIMFDFGN